MTREESIAYFKDMNECTYGDVEPIQMAIKALEKEPCEDCVSRKAIEKLKRYRFSYNNDTTIPKSDLFVKLTDLRDLPPVTLTRKKGKWKYSGSYDVEGMLYCSCCKHKIDVSEGYFKYCPNCGAEMESEE